MSEIQEKARESFDTVSLQSKTLTAKPKKDAKIQQNVTIHSPIAEENAIYVAQLQELVSVFSSSSDTHIRQYIINLTKGILERSGDYKRVEAYISEMTN